MIVWIIILLLTIVTCVAAYYSARNWHWANVTLAVLVFLMGIVAMLLEAKIVQIRAIYGKQIAAHEEQIETLQTGIDALEMGTRDPQVISRLRSNDLRLPDDAGSFAGIPAVDHELYLLTRLRGRTWDRVSPAGPMDPATGTIPVVIESPRPHGLDVNTIVYAFELGPAATPNAAEGPQYLGEFQVADAGENGVSLKPVQIMDEYEKARLARSRGGWILYETMPVDQHELFAGIPPEILKLAFPPVSAQEYIRHGSEATADDDQWHRVAYDESGKRLGPEDAAKAGTVRYVYERPLRDYDYIFQELLKTRTILWADSEAVTQDNAKLTESLASARQLQAFREDQIQKLSFDLKGMKGDRQAIESLLASLRRQVARLRERITQVQQENMGLVSVLTEQQLGPAQIRN